MSARDTDLSPLAEFVVKLMVATGLWAILFLIGRVVPVEWLTWWVAALIALVVTFGGWFVVVHGEDLW